MEDTFMEFSFELKFSKLFVCNKRKVHIYAIKIKIYLKRLCRFSNKIYAIITFDRRELILFIIRNKQYSFSFLFTK